MIYNAQQPVPCPANYRGERYAIMATSKSAHCCFDFTVVDTAQSEGYTCDRFGHHYSTICECFDQESAENVCRALNALDKIV